ncbi:ADP-ribosylglycohydrolase family protein [Aquibacillus albus]|uniref:ADP-ribosylglycohydrolase n=1 Tax=Aquibacillus albus TaxID=1168171 RepID=A0ABS2MW87_9BACI|nr:ADP-ribosylglycohydrolase family protein [Aquibacillus albus]MBM7570156.1 ADP-ribosylglycohydrolase [Aquibacillus albus]
MSNLDRSIGAYIGAAIGDAMGGPVESSHYKRIKKYAGEVKGLLPYEEPYLLPQRLTDPRGTFHPGYALHPDPGSITDDTFCRKDITKFILETEGERTPKKLASWLLENGELDTQWPQIMVGALHKIANGEVTAEECGRTYKQGGGIGWWFPIGIINAGDPKGAAKEGRYLSSIWKAPLEQDFVAAVVAGIAEGLKEDATYESMVGAMLDECGPLAKQLLERAIHLANEANDIWDLAEKLYENALMPNTAHIWEITEQDPPIERDALLPPRVKPIDYTDESYTTFFFAEQIPFALAAFVFKKGDVSAIPACCNLGRDTDTNANTVGAWVGALNGEKALPKEWVEPVCEVNKKELDIRDLAQKLSAVKVN